MPEPVPPTEPKPPSPPPVTPPPAPALGGVRRSSGPTGDPFAGVDRVARLQTFAAILLGLVLIAIPLYLWRRPRSDAPPITSESDAAAPLAAVGDAGPPAPIASAAPAVAAVTLSDPKVMECHDPGSKRTRPEDCDHLAAVEKGLAAAITSAAGCLPPSAGGGTLVYVVDASFARKRHPVELYVPRDGRNVRNAHATASAVKECTAAVRSAMAAVTLEGVPHAHQRYKTAITATYAPPPPGAP